MTYLHSLRVAVAGLLFSSVLGSTAQAIENDESSDLFEYPMTGSSWGERLNPNDIFPENGYVGYFFNTENPELLIHTEKTKALGITYSWSEYHNIKSEDFGAYWAGSFVMPEAGQKVITASLSWAEIRIIVDDHLVYEGDSNTEINLQLDEGRHTIEVEYANNWHNTDVMVRVLDSVQPLSGSQVQTELEDLSKPYQVFYAGVYESDAQDGVVQLDLLPSQQPMVLFLDSHNPVQWHINNPNENVIAAVVYSSYKPGAIVTGDLAEDTRSMMLSGYFGAYGLVEQCSCLNGHFYCSGKDFGSTLTQLESIAQSQLVGFSGKYGAGSLPLPQVLMNEETHQMMEDQRQKNTQLQQQCMQDAD